MYQVPLVLTSKDIYSQWFNKVHTHITCHALKPKIVEVKKANTRIAVYRTVRETSKVWYRRENSSICRENLFSMSSNGGADDGWLVVGARRFPLSISSPYVQVYITNNRCSLAMIRRTTKARHAMYKTNVNADRIFDFGGSVVGSGLVSGVFVA